MVSPTKRTDANRATILRALKLGATYKLAAESADMTYETLREWMREDAVFSAAVKKAEATRAQAAMRSIEKAAKEGQWQAAAWYLERRYPHEYGRTVQEHTGEQQLSITISKRSNGSSARDEASE